MRRAIRGGVVLLGIVVATSSSMGGPRLADPVVGLPPLLDRELFFGDPEISAAQISPDGRFVAFLKPLDGTRNLWVKKVDEGFDRARPMTADRTRPVPGFFWSRDSRYLLFVQDRAGDENFNVYAVDPVARVPEGARVPAARNLTDAAGVRAVIYAVPKSDPDVLYVGLNDRDPAWHDLYRVKISTAERTLVRRNSERIASWGFDAQGNLRLAERVEEDGGTRILAIDKEGLRELYSCSVFESCEVVRFHKDGRRLYLTTNRGAEVDRTRLVLLDAVTGQEEVIESDPEGRVDFGAALFSERTDDLLATRYEDERSRVYWRHAEFARDYEFLKERFPEHDLQPGSWTADERLWLLVVSSDREPGECYLFDRRDRSLKFQYRGFEELPRKHLAEMRSISYPSSDGLSIPAFLTLPVGVEPKGLPLVVFPHGGPWSRDAWGYDAFAQVLANRGYAVLQPNFRGSVGYGEAFLNAGNGEWGRKMQDDLTWGVQHLVGRGIADPKRVGIMGGSYGGYATLAGLAFTPDLYAAGVSIVGPSNLVTLLESIPPYWESIRAVFHARMGDPNTADGQAQLERQSPLNSASKIKTPLLVIQGANDPRVKQVESDRIVIAMRERNLPVEYLVAGDEGHGFARPVNNLAMFAATEKFLARYLGGRYQADLSPEVATRLAELTVDVKTVAAPKHLDPASVGIPGAATALRSGSRRYRARVEVGGQTTAMQVTREVARSGDLWEITDVVAGPMGEMRDRVVLDGTSLEVRRRTVNQGPLSIDIDLVGGMAAGFVHMGEDHDVVAVELGGPVFADGPGASEVIAALPLKVGYVTAFRNFDLQTQQPRILELAVAGVESVSVPAGTFEAWRIELVPAGGGPERRTVWVSLETREVVKTSGVLPQAGGAILTAELLP